MRVSGGVNACPDDAHEKGKRSGNEKEDADVVELTEDLGVRETEGVGRREVEEEEPEERDRLGRGCCVEVSSPVSYEVTVTGGDWYDSDGEVDGYVGQDNTLKCQSWLSIVEKGHTNVPPFIRQKLGQGKCSHLAICRSKTRDGHPSNHRICRLGCTNYYMADETDHRISMGFN